MAFLRKKEYPDSWSGYQRVSLKNGDIPGRKAKPYSMTIYTYSDTRAKLIRTFTDSRSPLSVDVSYAGLDVSRLPISQDPVFVPDVDEISDLYNQALSQIHSKVQKTRDDGFNGAVFISELPSTMKMFASTAKRVVDALRAVRRGDLSAARRALGVKKGGKPGSTAANNWLELKYGWLPLLSDIDSAAHKLATALHDVRRTFTVVANVKRISYDQEYTLSATSENYPRKGIVQTERMLAYQIGVKYGIASETIAHAASLGFTNPMLIAWETLPLSFVLDWILPIGNWLQGFSTFHGLEFVDGWQTEFGHTAHRYIYPGGSYTAYKGQMYYDGEGIERFRSVVDFTETKSDSVIADRVFGFRRSPLVEFPSRPSLRFDVKFSLQKLITSFALLRQRM